MAVAAAAADDGTFRNSPEYKEFSFVVLRSYRGSCEDLRGIPKFPEEFRKFKRNYRDGIDPEVTAAVPAEHFRRFPWNYFPGREFRPTPVKLLFLDLEIKRALLTKQSMVVFVMAGYRKIWNFLLFDQVI